MSRKLFQLASLSLVLGLILAALTHAQDAAEDPNLLGWWQLDEKIGITAYDSSGNANDGEFVSEPRWASGFAGGAIQLDGVDDFIEVPHHDSLLPDTEVTVMAWINTPRHVGPGGYNWQAILTKGGGPRAYSLYTEGSLGVLHFSQGPGGNYVGTVSTGEVPLNEWVHVCAMLQNGRHVYYINGEPAGIVGEGAEIVAGNTAPLRIGQAPELNAFLGKIDDVRVYNGTKTGEEIRVIMLSGLRSTATRPSPDEREEEVARDTRLIWKEGQFAERRHVYFGTDAADVNEASLDDPRGVLVAQDLSLTEFDPLGPEGLLDYDTVYYWRVDEVNTAPDFALHRGDLWRFTVRNFILLDDFEHYNDVEPNRVFDTWLDGFDDEGNGALVGYLDPDLDGGEHYVERTIVSAGAQSLPYFYDTDFKASQVTLPIATRDSDWTRDEIDSLSLWFRGFPLYTSSYQEDPPGTHTIQSAGVDIWATQDEFHFAYKEISGTTSIIARVDSLENTDPFAKAGIMVRDTLDADSRYAGLLLTPENGIRFQYRSSEGGDTAREFLEGVTAPYWVRLERTSGGLIRAYYAENGSDWTRFPLKQMAASGSVYVGLAVTSHSQNVLTAAQISNITMTGNGSDIGWTSQDVGIRSNLPQPIYVTLNDTATIYYEEHDPNAPSSPTLNEAWRFWSIPLQAFADQGADLTHVNSLGIGIGGRGDPQPGGEGTLFIDDVRLNRP